MIEEQRSAMEGIDPIQKEISTRLEQINPKSEILDQALYSARELRDTLNQTKPDCIIVSGNSGAISQMFVESSQALQPEVTLVKFSPQEVTQLYEAANAGIETPSLRDICESKGIKPDQKIQIVDDFLDSGNKAGKMLKAFDLAGIQNTRFTALSASPDSQPEDSRITLLNQDNDFYTYMDNLARTISISNKPDDETPAYNKYKDAMVFKSIGAMSQIRNHINNNLE